VALLAAWLWRDQLDWNILLPGLPWRLFITLYTLPAALTEARGLTGSGSGRHDPPTKTALN
jgi:hypothetical protein